MSEPCPPARALAALASEEVRLSRRQAEAAHRTLIGRVESLRETIAACADAPPYARGMIDGLAMAASEYEAVGREIARQLYGIDGTDADSPPVNS